MLKEIFIGVVVGLVVALANNRLFINAIRRGDGGNRRAGARAVTSGFLVKMGIDVLAVIGAWLIWESVAVLVSVVFSLTILGNFALYQMVFGKGGK